MSIHDGHRQRLKDRFLREGLDNFDELHVLELLLFYCIPRRDTNIIAHHLLEHFGTLTAVLEASTEELQKVEGVSQSAAAYLSLVMQASRYYQVKRADPGYILRSSDQCGHFLMPYFIGRETETVFLLCLDAKCKVICCKKVGEGNVNSANIPVRRVVEMALSAKATSVVLAHNHPSGLALPSADDIQTTYRMAAALEAVEIILSDHIVVAKEDFVSMAQSRYFTPTA
jgi:DNA repair protein RadC